MGIKRYFVLALVFATALGLYVYSFNGDSFTIELLGLSATLPVAIWAIIPIFTLIVASVLHMSFYYIVQLMEARSLKKDYESFLKFTKSALLNEDAKVEYKTHWFELLTKLLSQMELKKDALTNEIDSDELKEVIELSNKIYNNEVVELKKYRLRQSNPLVIQNRLNSFSKNYKFAIEALEEKPDSSSKLFQVARDVVLKQGTFEEIERLLELNTDESLTLFKRFIDNNDSLHMENDALEKTLLNSNFSKKDFTEAAKILKEKLTPDGLLALFERVYGIKPEASEAYLYILFELQMIDKAKEILYNSDAEEFEEFKLLLFLRDQGKQYGTDLFFK
ncbi:MAG: fatty-acid--CoA ligase [Sulfurospirillaceae bacterium]|nr:fatty-acid--CoA ligase [Sulfurospirillaceae bacterium]MCK9545325.1 fatty-acid--CoA ligase [Sulfurospirillaceae bacterium]MDY0238125.1 fatty-acid--CoA ligase [Campylobacterales bacterium]